MQEALDSDPVEALRSKGQEELSADLRSMVNDPEKSDVVFRCSDEKAVHCSRLFLASRCAVFKSMLSNGMLESSMSEIPLLSIPSRVMLSVIPLPSIPSRVMLSVVEFLYTGTIRSHPLCDWKMGFELIQAAQFLMIPTLERIAQDFLNREAFLSLRDEWMNPESISVLARMFSEAVEFPEAWDGKEEIMLYLEHRIASTSSKYCAEAFRCLSRNALECILHNSRREIDQEENQPSTEGYYILRNVVLWHVYQVLAPDSSAEKALEEELLPIGSQLWRIMSKMPETDGFMSDLSTSMDTGDCFAKLNSLARGKVNKESLEQMLLQHVRLPYIPASLLLGVVYQLNLYPPRELFKALVDPVNHSRVQCSLHRSDWLYTGHPHLMRIGNNGHISSKSRYRQKVQTALVSSIPEQGSSETFEWSFETFEDDASSIDIGFVCATRCSDDCTATYEDCTTTFDWGRLFDLVTQGSLRDSSDTRILCINRKEQKISVSIREPKSEDSNWEHFDRQVNVKSVVTFTVNESQKTCRVKVGDSFEAVGGDLSVEYYLPAIQFKDCLFGKARFRLGTGFDVY